MSKVLIIDTSYPINSRSARFFSTLKKTFDVSVVAWDRKKDKQKVEKGYNVFHENAEYGNKLKKLFKIPKFIKYLILILKKTSPDIIFASHWDSLLCIQLIQMLTKKRYKIIYDCLDLPTSSNIFITNILRFIEKRCIVSTDLTVFASRYFPETYDYNFEYIIFENYPSCNIMKNSDIPNWYKELKENKKKKTIISWIGVVRYEEILINILKSVQKIDCEFYVFGDGPSYNNLNKIISDYDMKDKVKLFGRYSQSELKYIYELSDFIWAAYPTKNYNAVHAISNKYYECSLFDKIIIISEKTKMAKNICNFKESCILINEYDIEDIINKINYFIQNKKNVYTKYENDSFWEDQENRIVKEINKLVDKNNGK